MKIFILTLSIIACLVCGYQSAYSEEIESLYAAPGKADVYFLKLPEMWYSHKKGNSYTAAQGPLQVRKSGNADGFLFKAGDSKNIYFWKDGSATLVESSQADWDKGVEERDYFSHENSELILGKDIDRALLNYKPPRGEDVLEVERTKKFSKVISFKGKTEKGPASIIPFTGGGIVYTGDIFLEFYSNAKQQPLSGLVIHMKKECCFLEDAFWYNESMYLINNKLNQVIIIKLSD